MGVREGKTVSRNATVHTILLAFIMGFLLCAPTIWSQESEAEFQSCLVDLSMADDGDLALTANEYVTFIALRSGGDLKYEDYSQLPLSLISNFNLGACFCVVISYAFW